MCMAEAIDHLLASHIARWPGEAAAGALWGPGFSCEARAGLVDKVFGWASVTKLLAALCCLVAHEEGTVSLGDAAGPPGSTLAHLLSHASGLPLDGGSPIAPPARRRIYSNAGIQTAAAHLAKCAGIAFGDYLSAGVLEPLGMGATTLDGSPAHGAAGPLFDLLSLGRELAQPQLVSPEALSCAASVAWPGLAGVVPGFGRYDPCDWGLGPEIRGQKSPHWTGERNSAGTYGHFGQSGCFLWVDPAAGVVLGALCSTPFGPWAKQAWPSLSDAVLAALLRQ